MTEQKTYGTCPDCRCVRTDANVGWPNTSRYCDYCLLDRVKAGEQVSGGTWHDEHTHLDHRIVLTLCQKCGGSGQFIVSAWQAGTDCHRCIGHGFVDSSRRDVQRIGRWSQTFQTNKRREVS